MSGELTNRDFWKNYWENNPVPIVEEKPFYSELIAEGFPGENARFLEIGGFPGIHCIYFQKSKSYQTTLLDFYVDRDYIKKVEVVNGVPPGSIEIIEGDFLNYETDKEYDVVFSAGFIEHFDDTREIIRRHVALVKPGGKLLITLPNFRGLNGWLQYLVDRKNYKAHNINSMKIDRLRSILSEMNLKEVAVFYFGRTQFWLDNPQKLPKWLVKVICLISGVLMRLYPIKWRFTSPNIGIIGTK